MSAVAKGILRRMNANFQGRTGLPKRLGALTVLVAGLVAGSVAAPAAAHEDSIDLVVFGDSYSAGIGAGTPAPSTITNDPRCFVSPSGYAESLSERQRAVELTANAACSGAWAGTGPSEPVNEDVPDVPQQIQLASEDGLLGAGTDLVTLTAGGNDVQFSRIIGACMQQDLAICKATVTQAEQAARTQVAPALALDYQQINTAAPDATIAVLGYPHLFSTEGATASPLSPEAAKVFNDGVDTLNSIIEGTAEKSDSVVYVDVTKRFRNHGIGSSEPWINFDPTNLQDYNNFHPNEKGYEKGYAKVLKPVVRSLQR